MESRRGIFFKAAKKLAKIPCSDVTKRVQFTASTKWIMLSITASSRIECALKFGHFVAGLNRLDDSPEYEITEHKSGNVYLYELSLLDGSLKVKLNSMIVNDSDAISGSQIQPPPIREGNQTSPFVLPGSGTLDEVITSTLQRYFSFQEFKPLQKEAIIETMSGRNLIVSMGTGGGKTLIFMLPAVLSSKLTVVVSPTLSLINDMIKRASELDIPACKFTSDVCEEEKERYLSQLESYKLCFCRPEVLVHNKRLAEKINTFSDINVIERIVFDECHIISTWGSTFRPLYKGVFEHLVKMNCPKLLLSATLSKTVEAELKGVFESETNITVLRQPIFRDNLVLQVKDRPTGSKLYDMIVEFINEHQDESGIIYCVLPKDVSKVHAELRKRNINCVKYHGQLSDELKKDSFDKWQSDQCHIIIANASFGLGIDKQNVRFVLHVKVPTSIDEYYQQCGRAGRDGEKAVCLLLYNYADKSLLYKLFYEQGNFDLQCEMLNDLLSNLENLVQCRHSLIMIYFGEERDFFRCMISCDNCSRRGSFHFTDGKSDAAKVVQTVVELTGKKFNFNLLKLVLCGSRQKGILESGYDSLSNFGCLQNNFAPKMLLDYFLHNLLYQGVLGEEVVHIASRNLAIYVKLGSKAHDLLAMRIDIKKIEKA